MFCVALQHTLFTCSSNDSSAFVQPYSIQSLYVHQMMVQLFLALQHILVTCSSNDSSAFVQPYSIYSLHVHQMIVQHLCSLTAYTRYMFIKCQFSICVALQHIVLTCSSNDGSVFVQPYSIQSLHVHQMMVQLL